MHMKCFRRRRDSHKLKETVLEREREKEDRQTKKSKYCCEYGKREEKKEIKNTNEMGRKSRHTRTQRMRRKRKGK